MTALSQSDTPLGQWFRGLLSPGTHRNVVIVAPATELARLAWLDNERNAHSSEHTAPLRRNKIGCL
ncbi:hypothetical protein AGR7C_pAt0098 [Agrobacterium deltaense Zutra 3/1]|uniref:Uncharacterized protein n=1 Tax=Agrobacterium deltaense Zutra 3/1 TaxID=1183427 RepID=A0A1S7S2L0_9HYPH|nr:hypothetical protein AGR7C_pAt0098 [Agrobacterium deltaense Zutra 3/1]